MIKPSIAVVDDDESIRFLIADLLRSLGIIAKGFASGDEFLHSHRVRLTSCLIAGAQMRSVSGLELFGRLTALGTPIPTILVMPHLDEAFRARALNAGIAACLINPFTPDELVESINVAGKQGAFSLPVKGNA